MAEVCRWAGVAGGRYSNARVSALLVGVLLNLSACSDEPTEGEKADSAMSAAKAALSEAVPPWAAGVAQAAADEFDRTGTVDPEALLSEAARTGGEVSDTVCETVAEDDGFSGELSLDAQNELSFFVGRYLMAAISRFPVLLYDLKVEWPPPWLLDPSKPPDYAQPVGEVDSGYFRAFLKHEFVTEDGGVLLPEEGESEYGNLEAWMRQGTNRLAGRGVTLSDAVIDPIKECI